MNFSNLLNHEESHSTTPFDTPQDVLAGGGGSRMSFDYLNSSENLSPAAAATGLDSPAFYSTPSEFVGLEEDHDGLGLGGGGFPSTSMLDENFHGSLGGGGGGGQDEYYNPSLHSTTFPPTYPEYPSFPSSTNLTQQTSTSTGFPPFPFTPSPFEEQEQNHDPMSQPGASFPLAVPNPDHNHNHNQTRLVVPPATTDQEKPSSATTTATATATAKKLPVKGLKGKGKGKMKGGGEDGIHSDGSSSAGAIAKPRPTKSKPSAAKSKRNNLLASTGGGTSTHSSPAPSPGPSSLSHEVHFDSPDVVAEEEEEGFDRSSTAFSRPIPLINNKSETSALKPLTTDHLKAATNPESADGLERSFREYVPPRVGPNGVVISDSEDEDDDDDAEWEGGRKKKQMKRSSKGKHRQRMEEEEEEEDGDGEREGERDDRLYCICRERYEPERMMIACDRCEEWYHIECVSISSDSVELVDQFFCPPCQTKYSQRTTWLAACFRPTCRNPSVALSKYCSDYCGISVVSARLELLELSNGTNPNSFWGRVEGSRRKEAKVIDDATSATTSMVDFQTVEDKRTLERLESKLEETNQRRKGLGEAISMVEKRLKYLKIVIKRWERLCQATADELANAGMGPSTATGGGTTTSENVVKETKKKGGKGGGGKKKGKQGKKKGPVAATSLPEAQCGLDVRLVYDDEAWREWVELESVRVQEGEAEGEEGEEPGGKKILEAQERGEEQVVIEMALEMLSGVCLETRKKCERHTGWQKLREADFQVEKAVLHRRLDRLSSLSQSLESQIALHQQATAFRLSNYNRSASPSRLIPVDSFMKEQEALRPRVKPSLGGSGGGNRRSTSPIVTRNNNHNNANANATPSFRRSDFVVAGGGGGEDGETTIDTVPSELLPFLSRAEIAKLKAQRK
ncbi:SPP1 family PHD finger domain-containing protein [Sporobolomyces salmoneus]|uniref:SPP1 family PHD finger domain-containing protein n=1 Tax=Sporobolomyces salmoneus TaxID=183962 RepID=UPI00317865E8